MTLAEILAYARARELPWTRTNELGRVVAQYKTVEEVPGDKHTGITLGAYRRGKRMPWVPGALIDVWSACARQESVTGVPWPHVYYITTKGAESSIYCPTCRAELALRRAAAAATPNEAPSAVPPSPQPKQTGLPF